jgi:hypothetical protein
VVLVVVLLFLLLLPSCDSAVSAALRCGAGGESDVQLRLAFWRDVSEGAN